MQERNYLAKKEQERQRRAQFDAALAKFKAGKVEEVGGQQAGVRDVGPAGHDSQPASFRVEQVGGSGPPGLLSSRPLAGSTL